MPVEKPSLIAQIEFPRGQAVSFDTRAFDEAINSQGVRMVHWRAMKCPVGLVDKYDNRRPGNHEGCSCSNGFIYTRAGELTILFTGNSRRTQKMAQGSYDTGSVQVTAQRFYDGTDDVVFVAPFDRLYLVEDVITVPTWQLFEAHITGRDRLRYPVLGVQDIMAADGRRFEEYEDFVVEDGLVVWVGSNRPTYDPKDNRGQICSARYLYRPFYVVQSIPHEIRVTQSGDMTGTRQIQRMPQAFSLVRETVFEQEDEISGLGQATPSPRSGSFGPR